MVITRSAMTPPNVNWFGWNLEHYEPNVGRADPGRLWASACTDHEVKRSKVKF